MKYCILLLFTLCFFAGARAQGKADTTTNAAYANAVVWTRTSGEFRALSFQAYNFARYSLDQALKNRKSTKPPCVIVDIDETILDNSAYYEHNVKTGEAFTFENLKNWVLNHTADTIPGALGFLQYAASKNVKVFYVTNREEVFTEHTLQNLKQFSFPNADMAHYLPEVTTYDKEPRRQLLAQTNDILLFAGDNLKDFDNFFYKNRTGVKQNTDNRQQLFGTKFIVLPNCLYGSWLVKKK